MDGLMEMSNLGLTIQRGGGEGERQTEASINPRRRLNRRVSPPPITPINKKRKIIMWVRRGNRSKIIQRARKRKQAVGRVSMKKSVYTKDKKGGSIGGWEAMIHATAVSFR